jgi:MoaA/NifB/PqqE/SkfB family radical SAM enzyme
LFRSAFQKLVNRFFPPPLLVDKPLAADVVLDESGPAEPILRRLLAWQIGRVTFLAGDDPEPDDLLQAVDWATDLGLEVGVRTRGSDLVRGTLLDDLTRAAVRHVDLLMLSAMGEVHDALAGVGDYRATLRAMDLLQKRKTRCVARIALVPSTWPMIDRTLEFLADRGVEEAEATAIATTDDEPSSWVLAAGELANVEHWLQERAERRPRLTAAPPQRFNPTRTLAEQVRRGPRCSATALRVEPDGRVFAPRGPYLAAGNLLTDDWDAVCRSDVFRDQRRRAEKPPSDPETWADRSAEVK